MKGSISNGLRQYSELIALFGRISKVTPDSSTIARSSTSEPP